MGLTTNGWLLPAWCYCLVSAIMTSIADGAGTVAFANGRSIDADANDAFQVHAADLDSDGDLDVIASLYTPDMVVWYENLDGKGTFAPAVEVSPCCDRDGPRGIATGDVDGDGLPDVVVAFEWSDLITWFRNADGLGGFSIGIDIATDANGAAWVLLEDIDGDGDLDVVSASYVDDRVTWYENTDGEGTFAVGLDLSTTSNEANALAAADLDDDGDVDIVVATYAGDSVTWFENSNGNGAFSLGVDLAVDVNGARYVSTADLDGDGDIDVVSASFWDGRVVWYENTDGAGTFAAGVDVDILTSAETVVAVDLDNDGDMDLVACDRTGGRIVWYENTDGEASFSAAIDIALDVGVREVIAADLDGDGDQDLLSASRTQDRVVWYENLLIELSPSPITVTPAPTAAPVEADPTPAPEVPAPVAAAPVGVEPTPAPEAMPTPVAAPVGAAPTAPGGTPAPVVAPSGAGSATPETSEETVTGGGGTSNADEIWIGVISSVIGGIILLLIGKYCISG